jgi:hypothetical protein
MEKKIKVLIWAEGHPNGDAVYRLDDTSEGERFFFDAMKNAEIGEKGFEITEMLESEWEEAIKEGEKSA